MYLFIMTLKIILIMNSQIIAGSRLNAIISRKVIWKLVTLRITIEAYLFLVNDQNHLNCL